MLGGHFDSDEHSQQITDKEQNTDKESISRHSEMAEPTQTREQKLSQEIQELKDESERKLTQTASHDDCSEQAIVGSAPEVTEVTGSQQDDPVVTRREEEEELEEDLTHYGYLDKKGAGLGFWKYQTRCKHFMHRQAPDSSRFRRYFVQDEVGMLRWYESLNDTTDGWRSAKGFLNIKASIAPYEI